MYVQRLIIDRFIAFQPKLQLPAVSAPDSEWEDYYKKKEKQVRSGELYFNDILFYQYINSQTIQNTFEKHIIRAIILFNSLHY